jgi:hypothetical protein
MGSWINAWRTHRKYDGLRRLGSREMQRAMRPLVFWTGSRIDAMVTASES